MKRVKLSMVLCLIFLMSVTLQAQKVKLISGNVKSLKGETELKLSYSYDGMAVGRFKSEAEYTQKKVEEYNKKEAGKGEKWLETWNNDKKQRFEPGFEEKINKILEKPGVVAGKDKNAKYTMIVKTIFFEPGFNVGIERKNARIDLELTVVETANPFNVIAKMTLMKVQGGGAMGFDFDSGYRVQKAYEIAGMIVGRYLTKNAYK